MWALVVLSGSVVVIAILAVYFPAVYIRKTDKVLKLLEQIEVNTRK
jgi:hypothetical protein